MLNKHREKADNPSIKIYVNKIENRITFKIKTGYYLETLTRETIKLLGSTENKIIKDEIVSQLVSVHCNIVKNNYQQDSRVLHTFFPNKSIGQFSDILPKNFVFLKAFDSEFFYSEVWFTDQNYNSLEIEDKINVTLVAI